MGLSLETIVGPTYSTDGPGITSLRAGKLNELSVGDAHGRYYESSSRGSLYVLSVAAGAATAYTGGAAGTPLIAIHNPTGSGQVLNLVGVGIASRVAASAAGTATFNLWGGISAQPTGTLTVPRNLLTMNQSGSVALGFANAVLTGSTALNLLQPIFTYYWATAAGAITGGGFFELNGMYIVSPGNQIALGATAALTSATYDVSLIWEEIRQ